MLALSANPIADAIFPSRERSLYSIAELRRLHSEPRLRVISRYYDNNLDYGARSRTAILSEAYLLKECHWPNKNPCGQQEADRTCWFLDKGRDQFEKLRRRHKFQPASTRSRFAHRP